MRVTQRRSVMVAIGGLLAVTAMAGELAASPAQAQNEVRRAIEWKTFAYTCDGGAKLVVYLHDTTAKVRFDGKQYLMMQTRSADGGRYSDGKVVWWSKGNGGFLEEDTPDGDGRMIVKDCQLDQPLDTGSVTGTVSYLQRLALPTNAVILVQLLDVSLADAPAKVIAEEKMNLGQRQVPVPFALKFDPTKIEGKNRYSVSAKILVDGQLRFTTDQSFGVLTQGNPTHVDVILKQVAAGGK